MLSHREFCPVVFAVTQTEEALATFADEHRARLAGRLDAVSLASPRLDYPSEFRRRLAGATVLRDRRSDSIG